MQFHFTPTSASWLNQVDVWFSILQGQSLSGTSFTSLNQLQEHIDAYVKAYNAKPSPSFGPRKRSVNPIQRPPYHSALIPGTSSGVVCRTGGTTQYRTRDTPRQILGKERRHIHASAIRPFPLAVT